MNHVRTVFYVSAIVALICFLMAGAAESFYTFLFALSFPITLITLVMLAFRHTKSPEEPVAYELIFFGILVLLAVIVRSYLF